MKSQEQAKHTPGPWRVKPAMYEHDCGFRIHTNESAPYGMAHIYSPGHCAEANARLIAAAPELLEALESILVWADPYAIPGCDRNESDVARARAAIAKATGTN